MARKVAVSAGQRRTGYAVLGILCGVAAWLLVEQAHFNPAVVALQRQPMLQARGSARGAAATTGPETETSALLKDLPGATPASQIETFDAETLSDKIDGKAELYLASNFKLMSCRTFSLEGARVEVFVYAMDSPRDAYAVFSGQRRSGAADSPLTTNAYATGNALFFAQGRYYAELVADRSSEQVARALPELGQALLTAMPGGETASAGVTVPGEEGQGASGLDETRLFPKQGLEAGTIRLAVSDAFGMEGLGNIFTADYRLDSGEATAFLAVRASAAEASDQADKYAAFLAANGYRQEAPDGLPEGARLLSLEKSAWEVVMARGRTLAGVHEATSREAALALAGAIAPALEGVK